MTLKEKVICILNQKNISYASLADSLGLTEAELDHAFNAGPSEIRTLERVSKELRIPLYSFFRRPAMQNFSEPYYNTSLWEEDKNSNVITETTLKKEINELQQELHKQETVIRELKAQLRKK